MTTAIEMFGIFFAGMFARALFVIAFAVAVSVPFIAYAYVARAIESAWHRHHAVKHAHGVA